MKSALFILLSICNVLCIAGPISFRPDTAQGITCLPYSGSISVYAITHVIQEGQGSMLCHRVRAVATVRGTGIGNLTRTGPQGRSLSSVRNWQTIENLTPGTYQFSVEHRGEEHYSCLYCPGVCTVPPIVSNIAVGSCTIPSIPTGGGGGDDEECGSASELPEWLLDELNDCEGASPIVLDLGRDGFLFGGKDTSIHYDLYADGTPIWINWLTPGTDDAFLVADHNDNGVVDDGAELFGHGTRILLENGAMAPNGFIGLAQYDLIENGGNDDFYISSQDAIWSKLMLWNDHNADGISSADELISLSDHGITRLETIPRSLFQIDGNGNYLPLWGTVFTADEPIDMVDVFFKKHRHSLTAGEN